VGSRKLNRELATSLGQLLTGFGAGQDAGEAEANADEIHEQADLGFGPVNACVDDVSTGRKKGDQTPDDVLAKGGHEQNNVSDYGHDSTTEQGNDRQGGWAHKRAINFSRMQATRCAEIGQEIVIDDEK
jgi:hypothetical protein